MQRWLKNSGEKRELERKEVPLEINTTQKSLSADRREVRPRGEDRVLPWAPVASALMVSAGSGGLRSHDPWPSCSRATPLSQPALVTVFSLIALLVDKVVVVLEKNSHGFCVDPINAEGIRSCCS